MSWLITALLHFAIGFGLILLIEYMKRIDIFKLSTKQLDALRRSYPIIEKSVLPTFMIGCVFLAFYLYKQMVCV